jgi:hypothetical protein
MAAWGPAGAVEPGSAAAARAEFLESRLDAARSEIVFWQDGWTAVYAGAAVFHGARAFANSDTDDQVANGVSALRALTAITLMRLRPHPGRYGSAPAEAAGPPGSVARLEAAEQTLAASARRAAKTRTVRRHLANVGANLVFGGLILAFGDEHDALVSTALGIAGGTAVLVTSPQQPRRDLDAYREQFAGPARTRAWQLHVDRNSVGFTLKFR